MGVTGIPQFDIYADKVGARTQDEFLREHGLAPGKQTILFATSSPAINPEDPEILRRLAETLDQEIPVQILAQLHPLDSLARYKGIAHSNLAFQVPGAHLGSSGEQRLLDPNFLVDLRDTLLYSDVVVNTSSTMSLDAVAIDTPVVNIAFDLEPTDYYKSRRRNYDFEHYQPIVESGATRIAWSFEEFVSLIRRYLGNPEMESPERARLRETMCYQLDGQSAWRVADYIHRALQRQLFDTQSSASENLASDGQPTDAGRSINA